jgi:hypothetical protein
MSDKNKLRREKLISIDLPDGQYGGGYDERE